MGHPLFIISHDDIFGYNFSTSELRDQVAKDLIVAELLVQRTVKDGVSPVGHYERDQGGLITWKNNANRTAWIDDGIPKLSLYGSAECKMDFLPIQDDRKRHLSLPTDESTDEPTDETVQSENSEKLTNDEVILNDQSGRSLSPPPIKISKMLVDDFKEQPHVTHVTVAKPTSLNLVQITNLPALYSKEVLLHEINRNLWEKGKCTKPLEAAQECFDPDETGNVYVQFVSAKAAADAAALKKVEIKGKVLVLCQKKLQTQTIPVKTPTNLVQILNLPPLFSKEVLLHEINRNLWEKGKCTKPLEAAQECFDPDENGETYVQFVSVKAAADAAALKEVEIKGRELVLCQKELKTETEIETVPVPVKTPTNLVQILNLPPLFSKEVLLHEINRNLWEKGKCTKPLEAAQECFDPHENGEIYVQFVSVKAAADAAALKEVEIKGRELVLCQKELKTETEIETVPVPVKTPTNLVQILNLPPSFSKEVLLHEINRNLWEKGKCTKPLEAAQECFDPDKNGDIYVQFVSVKAAADAAALKEVEIKGRELLLCHKELETEVETKTVPVKTLVQILNLPPSFSKEDLLIEINRNLWDEGKYSKPQEAAQKCFDPNENGEIYVQFVSADAAAKAVTLTNLNLGGRSLILLYDDNEFQQISTPLCATSSSTIPPKSGGKLSMNSSGVGDDCHRNPLVPHNFKITSVWDDVTTDYFLNLSIANQKTTGKKTIDDKDLKSIGRKIGMSIHECRKKKESLYRTYRTKSRSGTLSNWVLYGKVHELRTGKKPQVEETDPDPFDDSMSDVSDDENAVPVYQFNSKKKWIDPEREMLIDEWSIMKEDLSKIYRSNDLWKPISLNLCKLGCVYSPKQCELEMGELLDQYKRLVDRDKSTGVGRAAAPLWPFYEKIHRVLGNSLTVKPKVLFSAGSSSRHEVKGVCSKSGIPAVNTATSSKGRPPVGHTATYKSAKAVMVADRSRLCQSLEDITNIFKIKYGPQNGSCDDPNKTI